jgi:predicted aspartyl protease
MGTFTTTIGVAASADGPFEAIEALVDSGATYTLLPSSRLRRLGVEPIDREAFLLADGRRIEREVGQVWVRIGDRVRMSVAVFGPEEGPALLGAVTLEEFALGIDTLRRELIRVPGYLVGIREEGDA